MFSSSNTTPNTASKLFTGLTSFTVLDVNPSKEQIEKYLGREYKLNVNYDIVDFNGRQMRPIEIWLKETSGHMDALPIRFYISTADDITQSGTARYVNDKGMFTQSKTRESLETNDRMAWFNAHSFRVAKVGENELYTFMQRLMRYNSRGENAAFLEDCRALNITAESIFNNDLSGLRKFFTWCNENNNQIIIIAAVRTTSKLVDGEEKIYYNQTLANNPNFMFQTSTGEVSARAISAVKDAVEKGERPTKFLFTVEFQPFVKEECVNNVPADTVSNSQQQAYNPSDLL